MLMQSLEGQKLLAHFPGAQAVHAVCHVNCCSTTTLPMACREEDGLWEATLPEDMPWQTVGYLVYWSEESEAQLYRQDIGAAEAMAV